MKKVNIFLAHTPFQNYVANHMVYSMEEFRNVDNILILDSNHKNLNIKKEIWTNIIISNPAVGLKFYKNINEREMIVNNILKEIESNYNEVNIFLANISYTLNNLFFGIYKNRRKYNFEITLNNYPEGIANLLLENIKLKQFMKDIIRNFYGLVKCTKYYVYRGDITGIKYSDKVYSLSPEFMETVDKQIIAIPKLKNDNIIKFENKIGIILGQPYYSMENKLEFKKMIEEMVDFMKNLGYKEIYYKPHHYEDQKLLEEVKNYVSELIIDHNPIEQYIKETQISGVIGFTSSALINLKAMYGENIECISYKGLDFIKDNKSKEKLTSIYNGIGIVIVEN
ncbi:MAG: polysialyltransferase family glycosyltransferase [Paraclostridium dentum]|uniref:polysialyltransferase family glycosyltransferase n=1 Tax=Paraclostridium dentum TaxID=2662455 RepID=UPI003EE662D0